VDHQEIGLPSKNNEIYFSTIIFLILIKEGHIFKELKQLLLKVSKESTEAIWLAWVFYHSNSNKVKMQIPLD
jgi:hypothetical protein